MVRAALIIENRITAPRMMIITVVEVMIVSLGCVWFCPRRVAWGKVEASERWLPKEPLDAVKKAGQVTEEISPAIQFEKQISARKQPAIQPPERQGQEERKTKGNLREAGKPEAVQPLPFRKALRRDGAKVAAEKDIAIQEEAVFDEVMIDSDF